MEIDMREEAQKGRVSDRNQRPSYILWLCPIISKVATLQELEAIKISLL